MFNVIEVQDQLRNFSQDQLMQEMQAPSGTAPQYLVLAELTRRKKMQDDAAAQQGGQKAQTTVAEDAIAAAGIPSAGARRMGQTLAPRTDMAGNTGIMSMKSSPEPVQKMQRGGAVDRDQRTRIEVLARRRGLSPELYMQQFGGPTMGDPEVGGYNPGIYRPGVDPVKYDRFQPSPYLSQPSPDEPLDIERSSIYAMTDAPMQKDGINQMPVSDINPSLLNESMGGFGDGPLASLGRFMPSPYLATPSMGYDDMPEIGNPSGLSDEFAAMNRTGIDPASTQDREILAKTINAEAGGESLEGKLGVGAVIANRARMGSYGGSSIRDVIMKPGQFSAWNNVTGYAGGEGGLDMSSRNPTDEDYRVADMILSGRYEDPTGGATHYYALQGMKGGQMPSWAEGKESFNIGNHTFLNADAGKSQAPVELDVSDSSFGDFGPMEGDPGLDVPMPMTGPGMIASAGVMGPDQQTQRQEFSALDPVLEMLNIRPGMGPITDEEIAQAGQGDPTRPQARPSMQGGTSGFFEGPIPASPDGIPIGDLTAADLEFPDEEAVSRNIQEAEESNARLSSSGPSGRRPPAGRGGAGGAPSGGGNDTINSILDKRMADIQEERENAKWMALANFGMALMSESGGSFLGNVGTSGQAAMQNYQKSMQDVTAAEDAIIDAQLQQAVANRDYRRSYELAAYKDRLQRSRTRDRLAAELDAETRARGIGGLGWDADQNRQIEATVMDEKQAYDDAKSELDSLNDPDSFATPEEVEEARQALVNARERYNNAYAQAAARIAGADISGNVIDLN